MPLFSERYGYTEKPFQLESMTPELRNRIWNIYQFEVCADVVGMNSNYLEEIMDVCGLPVSNIYEETDLKRNLDVFHKWFNHVEWYKIYDFIETYLAFLRPQEYEDAKKCFNDVLTGENAGYRVVGKQVVPITNESEISCIEHAEQTAYSSVNLHIKKASELFSRRPLPDYENSIKESISAVEALCCIITGQSGANATLGKTIKVTSINQHILKQ